MATTRSKSKKSLIGVIPGGLYVKIWVAIMLVYSAQMVLVPSMMVTEHFEMASTPMLDFWIRGSSIGWLGLSYLLTKVDTATAVPIATLAALGIGVLYPWNAKFGYLTPGLPVKYPMHYVPEVLMLALSVGGVLAM